MDKIGVLTSGGDAPGMNAAIRAVVRRAFYHGVKVMGIRRGFSGLVEADAQPLDIGATDDIIHRGGTVLHTARSGEFETAGGRAGARDTLERFGLQGLVVIGGDGSFRGAASLHCECGLPVVAIPATIDNDVVGTEYSIGFDTAVNAAVEAMDRIRDTATSHERTFVVEVMGRSTGFIALTAGLAGGAESIVIPEEPLGLEDICTKIRQGHDRGKPCSIIVVAEGAVSATEMGGQIRQSTGFDTRVIILGHLQRGGAPTALDRVLATRLGAGAVDLLVSGATCQVVGQMAGRVVANDLAEVVNTPKTIDLQLYHLAGVLAV